MRGDSGRKVGQRGQDLQKRTKAVEVRAEGELNSSLITDLEDFSSC